MTTERVDCPNRPNHHLLMDGWSLPVLMRELFVLYGQEGHTAALPRVTPYRDYLGWLAAQDRQGRPRLLGRVRWRACRQIIPFARTELLGSIILHSLGQFSEGKRDRFLADHERTVIALGGCSEVVRISRSLKALMRVSNILNDRSSCAFETFSERNLSWKLLERISPVFRSTRCRALRVETINRSGSLNSFSTMTLGVSSIRTNFSYGGHAWPPSIVAVAGASTEGFKGMILTALPCAFFAQKPRSGIGTSSL
jgi:hypothetical protein